MRRLVLAIGAMAGTVAVAAAVTSITAFATVAFAISGSAAGGVKAASVGDQVTFVFTEKNTGTVAEPEDIVIKSLTNATIQNLSCVTGGGAVFNPDGSQCEPGFVAPGAHDSAVVSVTITGGPTATIKVCLTNESNGATGACKTISISS